MKGNELELWIASLTTCNFITVQSNRWMLIVNKHCAIFTTSIIKRTLGKVPKEDKCYEVYGQLYEGLTSSTSRFLVRDSLVPGFSRVWWWRFNSVSTPLLFFRWPIVLSPLYTTKCSFFDSFLVLSDNSYAVYWNSSFGGQSDLTQRLLHHGWKQRGNGIEGFCSSWIATAKLRLFEGTQC